MPTKALPPRPNLAQLKEQAKDLRRERTLAAPAPCQRVREFHPRFAKMSDSEIAAAPFTLSDAYFAIAREYGFASWPRLKAHIEGPPQPGANVPHHERIQDPIFRRAVDLIDDGDAPGLAAYLEEHPGLVQQHIRFEGGNYFQHPALLGFIAENPIRHESMAPNIVEIAKLVLDAGAKHDHAALNETLALVASGRVARECGVQIALIDLLCDYGAKAGLKAALSHGEFAAAEALIRRGAKLDLPAAAALGRTEDVRALLPAADLDARHLALAFSAQHGHGDIVGLLLAAGEDPNRYNPRGAHAHSTPLHQAVWHGHEAVVRLLIAHGARRDLKDILHQGSPLDWALYGKRDAIAAYLRGLEN